MTIKKKFYRNKGKYIGLYKRKFDRRAVLLNIQMLDEALRIESDGASRIDLMKVGDICVEEMVCEEFRVDDKALVLINPDYAAFSEKDTEILMQDAFEELNCDVKFAKEQEQ